MALKILLSKILVLQRCLLKLISSLWFKLAVPLVINILSVHYLWLAKAVKILSQNFFLKEKSFNLKNFNPQKF